MEIDPIDDQVTTSIMEVDSTTDDELETASTPSQSSADTHGPVTPTDTEKRRLSALASIDILSATLTSQSQSPNPSPKDLSPLKMNIKTPLSDPERSPKSPPGIRRKDVSDAVNTLEEIIENIDDDETLA